MLIFLAILILIGVLAWRAQQFRHLKTGFDTGGFIRYGAKLAGVLLSGALVLTFLVNCVVIVPAGHRAVIFDVINGGVKPVALGEGLNFIMPFTQEATLVDIRVQKVEYDAEAASKDLQTVHTKVAVNFHPLAEQVPALFREVGPGYTEKVIHPAVQEAVKASCAKYTAEELITKRDQIKAAIQEHMEKVLQRNHVVLLETYITNFDFSGEFSRAIEAKQVAEQQALKARRDLDRIKIEAEQAIATARAQAESLRLQRDSVTPNLIELRKVEAQKAAIDKWNGQLPTTMLGGATPFIDVSKFK